MLFQRGRGFRGAWSGKGRWHGLGGRRSVVADEAGRSVEHQQRADLASVCVWIKNGFSCGLSRVKIVVRCVCVLGLGVAVWSVCASVGASEQLRRKGCSRLWLRSDVYKHDTSGWR